ncbi:MAG: glycosyltransferase [Candidatus Moraniibacteriota bacterium]
MKSISLIIPAYNEEQNIRPLYEKLQEVLAQDNGRHTYEILFVNDGSGDGTSAEIERLGHEDNRVRQIEFSRNFGKELATTAGLNSCTGDACILLDADLQHPIELIPDFIAKWEDDFEVVVGVRRKSKSDSWVKVFGSKIFYVVLNKIAHVKIIPNATDFRLLDRQVIDEFNRFSETNRLTRGLIDWLGFNRAYIYFDANERLHGTPSYSFIKLAKLAFQSFISLSFFPLKLAGYLGIFITTISGLAGVYIFIGRYLLYSKFALSFSDSEVLAIFIVFLVGIILMSIGLISLYIANIHEEVIHRPLYIVRKRPSAQGDEISENLDSETEK